MNESEIKKIISEEVKAQIGKEKKSLAKLVEEKLLYMGEFVGASRLMDAINDWSNK